MMGKSSKILIVLAVLIVLGLGFFFMGSDDDAGTAENEIEPVYNDYKLVYDKVKPDSSVIEMVKTESKSSTYAFFEQTSGKYAEPAYNRYVSENVFITIDISKLKLSGESYIDDSADKNTKEGNIYNQSHLKKDLKKLLKNHKYPAYLNLYNKEGLSVATINDLKVSLDGNILTAKYSYSNTSKYYTEYERSNYLTTKFNGDNFALNTNFDNIKKAKLFLLGDLEDKDSNRTVTIDITTKNMKVSSSISTDFKSTYDDD